MRRAAFSTAANIAEGAAKRGRAEFRRFLDMSLGSLSELSVAIRLAKDLSYIDTKQGEEISEACARAGKVTMGLYKAIQSTIAIMILFSRSGASAPASP